MNDQEFLNNEKAQSKSFENKAIFNSPCLFTSSYDLFATARPFAKSFQNERGQFIGISTGVGKKAIVTWKAYWWTKVLYALWLAEKLMPRFQFRQR